VTSSLVVFEATGKINASDKIMFENQKKRNMEIKDIFSH